MKDRLAAAAKSRVVFVGGNDNLARAEAIDEILPLAGASADETESVQADSQPPVQWFAAVSTAPFFSDRRVIVVRNIGRLNPEKVWDNEINKNHPAVKEMFSLPDTGFLLLVADDEAGDEDRQAKAKTVASKWSKLVTLAGGSSLTYDIDPTKTVSLVQARAKALGKAITPRAAHLLSEMVSHKPVYAVSELEKVVLYVGDSKDIQERDVQSVVLADNEYNVYKFVDAIIAGDAKGAVHQMRTLFSQTSQVADQVIPRVFPTLLSQLRLVWQARFCIDEGTDPVRPDERIAPWLPSKKLSSDPDWKQQRIVQTARRLSLPKIQRCLDILVDADAEAKGQRPSISINESLERMALLMCRVCANKPS